MYTQKKPIENTHIVRERDRRRNRELLAVLFLGVPIGLFLLLFAWQNLEVIHLGREASRLQKELKAVEVTQKALEAELDALTSFDRVEAQVSELGFAAADPSAIVTVEVSPSPVIVPAPAESSADPAEPVPPEAADGER